MIYNDFMKSGWSDVILANLSLKITTQISKWILDEFKIILKQNKQYPNNGFKLSCQNKAGMSERKFSYIFQYGIVTCETKDVCNHYNSYKVKINKDLIDRNGFYNEEFIIYFDDSFEMTSIINEIAYTKIKNILITSSIETIKNTKKKLIKFIDIGVNDLEIESNKENEFFLDFHCILENIYNYKTKKEMKEWGFNNYPEIEDICSCKNVWNLFAHEYENNYEELQKKIKILEIFKKI